MDQSGSSRSSLLIGRGQLLTFNAPGPTNTMALGINNNDEMVGSYATGTGSRPLSLGFVWRNRHFRSVDDPRGVRAQARPASL